jgi:hypothetical protein
MDKTKPEVKKRTFVKTIHVHNAISQGRLMHQACRSVTLDPPLIFFHGGIYNSNGLGAFWHNLIQIMRLKESCIYSHDIYWSVYYPAV